MGCPSCGKPLRMSEHAFFSYDVIAVKCDECRLYSIVGADRFVQFPRCLCVRCFWGVPHLCELADPDAAYKAFCAAHQAAMADWTALAKEVHDRTHKPAVDPWAGCSRFAVPAQGFEGVDLDPPKPAETWRDRPPLL